MRRTNSRQAVPLAERVDAFFELEVRLHFHDAWIDTSRRDPARPEGRPGRPHGCEINFNCYFYRFTPPRPLKEIEGEIRGKRAEVIGGPA